jgi:outer membrane immunogenic protein
MRRLPPQGERIMKKILLATVSLLGLASAAVAADLPMRGVAPVQNCAARQFQGGYIGINGGGVHWTANRTDQDQVLVDSATYVQKEWGWAIGGHLGYNWGTCNTIFGLEVDGNWIDADVTTHLIPNAPFFNINVHSRLDGVATARFRTGIAVDNLLFYATGGLAGGHFRTTFTSQIVIPGVISQTNSANLNDDWRLGWVAGFGTEWAFSPNWILRSEVLYLEFADREKRVLFAPPAGFANFTQSDSMWLGRVGVSYRFGAVGPY